MKLGEIEYVSVTRHFNSSLICIVQYHNFLMRALLSNANLMSERAIDGQFVSVGDELF
jgi:hypothetical protein